MSNHKETFTRQTAHAMFETLRAQSHLEADDYQQLHAWNDEDAYSATELVRIARLGQLTCGHLATPRDGSCGAGYATLPRNRAHRLCYSCANAMQREDFRNVQPGGRFTAYMSASGHFTDWAGSGIGRGDNPDNPNDDGRGMMLHVGADHPWSPNGERFYVSARDCFGREWFGTAGKGMYCQLTQSVNAPVLAAARPASS